MLNPIYLFMKVYGYKHYFGFKKAFLQYTT